MTKHIEPGTPASDRPVLEIEVTDAMVEAGVNAYLGQASHDEMSFRTPKELILEVLQAALVQRPS